MLYEGNSLIWTSALHMLPVQANGSFLQSAMGTASGQLYDLGYNHNDATCCLRQGHSITGMNLKVKVVVDPRNSVLDQVPELTGKLNAKNNLIYMVRVIEYTPPVSGDDAVSNALRTLPLHALPSARLVTEKIIRMLKTIMRRRFKFFDGFVGPTTSDGVANANVTNDFESIYQLHGEDMDIQDIVEDPSAPADPSTDLPGSAPDPGSLTHFGMAVTNVDLTWIDRALLLFHEYLNVDYRNVTSTQFVDLQQHAQVFIGLATTGHATTLAETASAATNQETFAALFSRRFDAEWFTRYSVKVLSRITVPEGTPEYSHSPASTRYGRIATWFTHVYLNFMPGVLPDGDGTVGYTQSVYVRLPSQNAVTTASANTIGSGGYEHLATLFSEQEDILCHNAQDVMQTLLQRMELIFRNDAFADYILSRYYAGDQSANHPGVDTTPYYPDGSSTQGSQAADSAWPSLFETSLEAMLSHYYGTTNPLVIPLHPDSSSQLFKQRVLYACQNALEYFHMPTFANANEEAFATFLNVTMNRYPDPGHADMENVLEAYAERDHNYNHDEVFGLSEGMTHLHKALWFVSVAMMKLLLHANNDSASQRRHLTEVIAERHSVS